MLDIQLQVMINLIKPPIWKFQIYIRSISELTPFICSRYLV